MKTKIFMVLFSLISLFATTGCYGVNGDFKDIRNTVFGSLKGKFKKDVEFSIGSAGISLAGLFVSFAETDEPIEEMLDKVSKIQVGVYKHTSNEEINDNYFLLREINDELIDSDWQCIVKSREDNEMVCIFIKMDDELLNKMLVIALDGDELVITELSGELNELIEIALRDHKFDLG